MCDKSSLLHSRFSLRGWENVLVRAYLYSTRTSRRTKDAWSSCRSRGSLARDLLPSWTRRCEKNLTAPSSSPTSGRLLRQSLTTDQRCSENARLSFQEKTTIPGNIRASWQRQLFGTPGCAWAGRNRGRVSSGCTGRSWCTPRSEKTTATRSTNRSERHGCYQGRHTTKRRTHNQGMPLDGRSVKTVRKALVASKEAAAEGKEPSSPLFRSVRGRNTGLAPTKRTARRNTTLPCLPLSWRELRDRDWSAGLHSTLGQRGLVELGQRRADCTNKHRDGETRIFSDILGTSMRFFPPKTGEELSSLR